MGMPIQDIRSDEATSMCFLSSSIQQSARMAAARGPSAAPPVDRPP